LRHGNGKLELSNRVVIEGLWQNNQFQSGKVGYPDGDVYTGEMRDWVRNGQGTYSYTDQSQYIGQWLNNMKHGNGEYSFANGDQYKGGFKDNLKHGYNGTYSWKEGGWELVDANFLGDKYQTGNLVEVKRKM
jgi:1-phosphatidylinositol-4-phosphate 5-kinase